MGQCTYCFNPATGSNDRIYETPNGFTRPQYRHAERVESNPNEAGLPTRVVWSDPACSEHQR